MADRMKAVAENPKFSNITLRVAAGRDRAAPRRWTWSGPPSNYHDFAMPKSPFGTIDIAKMNKAIYDALEPGGALCDHRPRGCVEDQPRRHRSCTGSDEALVKGRCWPPASGSTARAMC